MKNLWIDSKLQLLVPKELVNDLIEEETNKQKNHSTFFEQVMHKTKTTIRIRPFNAVGFFSSKIRFIILLVLQLNLDYAQVQAFSIIIRNFTNLLLSPLGSQNR